MSFEKSPKLTETLTNESCTPLQLMRLPWDGTLCLSRQNNTVILYPPLGRLHLIPGENKMHTIL